MEGSSEYKILLLAGLQILRFEKNVIKNLGDINLARELVEVGFDIDISSEHSKLIAGCELIESGLWGVYGDEHLSAKEKATINNYVWKIVSSQGLDHKYLVGIMRANFAIVMQPLVPDLKECLVDTRRKRLVADVVQRNLDEDDTVAEKVAYLWSEVSPEGGMAYIDHCLDHGQLPQDDSWFEEFFNLAGEIGGDDLRMKFSKYCLAQC